MDGDVYEDFRSHFMLLCVTEMDACTTIHKQYSSVWESVGKVCDYHVHNTKYIEATTIL